MKVYHYLSSWLITLFIGVIIGATFFGDPQLSFGFGVIAAACSAPFMLIFCILMFTFLKKKPSVSELHSRTFLLHVIGSVLTVGIPSVIINEVLPAELYLAIFGYFVVDSICFHAFIHAFHKTEENRMLLENDILDSQL